MLTSNCQKSLSGFNFKCPLDYWAEEGLSYIASAVGKPLYADTMTISCMRLSFARICVEVDVDFVVMVKYHWKL